MDKNERVDDFLLPNPFLSPQTSASGSENTSHMKSAIVPRRTRMTSVASVEYINTPPIIKISDDTIGTSSSDKVASLSDQELEIDMTPLLATESPLALRQIAEARQRVVTDKEGIIGPSGTSLHTEVEFHEETFDCQLSWALESDEEGSFEGGVDWTFDEVEIPYYREIPDGEEVDHGAEPSMVLTTQQIENLGRRLSPLRKLSSPGSPVAVTDLGAPDNKNFFAANIIGADTEQSASGVSAMAAPQPSSNVKTAQSTVESMASCLNVGVGVTTKHHPSNNVGTARNIMDPIGSCFNFGASILSPQDTAQKEHTFPVPDAEDIIMTDSHTFRFSMSVPPEITSDILKPQMVHNGEVKKIFAESNIPISEPRSPPDCEDWRTLLSRAGVPETPTDTYPMFESDASLLSTSATIPYTGDVEMGDFGWLDDATIDFNTNLDPQLAMANDLPMMGEVCAGSSPVIGSLVYRVEGTEFTTSNAIQQALEQITRFDHSDMELNLYDVSEGIPEALVGASGNAFQGRASTTEFTILPGYGNTGLSHQVVTDSLESDDSNLDDCLSAFSTSPPPSSRSLQPASNFSLPGPEGGNDDQTIMAAWFSTLVGPDEIMIDGDIKSVKLPCPNAISISSELSVPATFPPMSPIVQKSNPDISPITVKADNDMIDLPLQSDMLDLPVPINTLVTATIHPLISPSSLSVAGGRKTKTPLSLSTRLDTPVGRPIQEWLQVDTLEKSYSIALGLLLIIKMSVGLVAAGNNIFDITLMGACIVLSLFRDSHYSCRGWSVDVTSNLVQLAKGLLFVCTLISLTGFSWLNTISLSLKIRGPVNAGVSNNINEDDVLWENLTDVTGLVVDKVSKARVDTVDIVGAATREEPVIIAAEHGEWAVLEENMAYESLADVILGPAKLPGSCERYNFGVGAGEVAMVVEKLGYEEIGFNESARIAGGPGTAICIENGTMVLLWAVSGYRALMAWKRM